MLLWVRTRAGEILSRAQACISSPWDLTLILKRKRASSAADGKSKNAVMSILKTMNFIMKIIEGSSKEVYEICKGKDLIIVTHSQMGAVEAGVLGIPKVNVTLQTEMIGEKLRKQKFGEKLIGGFIAKQAAKPTNKIRKIYGLKPVKSADEEMSDKLNLIPISKYVIDRNPYWEEKNVIYAIAGDMFCGSVIDSGGLSMPDIIKLWIRNP